MSVSVLRISQLEPGIVCVCACVCFVVCLSAFHFNNMLSIHKYISLIKSATKEQCLPMFLVCMRVLPFLFKYIVAVSSGWPGMNVYENNIEMEILVTC